MVQYGYPPRSPYDCYPRPYYPRPPCGDWDRPSWKAPPCPRGTMPYVIQSGDTFYKLAQRFNTTVAAISAVNPGVDPNNLQIGQVICIPVTKPAPICPPGTIMYTIKAGDTFYALAARFGTTVEAIMRVNPGVDPKNLQIGQVVCIPMVSPVPICPPGSVVYVIKAGDTFYKLASRFGTTVEAIMKANPGVDPKNLQIGQRICIPIGK
ncbi:MAG TPA: LysM peptidoglycan-binding domain-containing protein [Clostridiales bacterium]|nr:LysM peptidoglycan-binding domain-containing protein [Clostridiales bacterium]